MDEGQVVCGTESETERGERGEECEGDGERRRRRGRGRERWRNKWKEKRREREDEKGTYGERERGDEPESRAP